MSQAGRGKPNHIPGMRIPNGNSIMEVPPDLVWDEDNPPIIFGCTQHTEHHPQCPQGSECPPIQLDSESQVDLLNEARAWNRAGMNYHGLPFGFPGQGIPVEILDLLIWVEAMKDVVIELSGISEFEFEEKFRERKLGLLQQVRGKHEDRVRRQRVASSIGIVEKPPLLGPDGRPL